MNHHLQMKFTLIGPNRVQCDQGFVLWLQSPSRIHYSEGELEVIVPGEMLVGKSELLVSVSGIKTWAGEAIDQTRRDQIASNIRAALNHLGIRCDFD